MRKVLEIILLLSVIGVTILYSVFYYFFNLADQNNEINRMFRKRFLRYELARTLLKLHQVGDARFDYAGSDQFTTLRIVPFIQYGESLDKDTLGKVSEEITRAIPKALTVQTEPAQILYNLPDNVNDDNLFQLTKEYRLYRSRTDNITSLQIFVLKRYIPSPTYAGIVLDEGNIFLFRDAIRDVSDKQPTTRNAEISTILHEYAHLLGAEHTNDDNCILAPEVENVTFFNIPATIIDTYCQNDIAEIQKAVSF